jgi:hypothetical protein
VAVWGNLMAFEFKDVAQEDRGGGGSSGRGVGSDHGSDGGGGIGCSGGPAAAAVVAVGGSFGCSGGPAAAAAAAAAVAAVFPSFNGP